MSKIESNPKDVFLGSEPPPVWISRAINPPSRAFCRGDVDFFWNNPLFKGKIAANKSCKNLLFCLRYTFLFSILFHFWSNSEC